MEPAKSRIVFNADEGIYTIAADGSGRTRLNPGQSNDAEPAWSPDGASIAFSRGLTIEGKDEDEDEERSQIWVMAADGSGARPVSAGPKRNRIDLSPAWSPDGERIAFMRYRFTSEALVSQLITVAAAGGDERVVTEIKSTLLGSASSPAWSPDGARILLTQQRLGKGAYFRPTLYVVDVATGARTKLLDDAEEGSWSPDGAQIAYASVADKNGEECGSDECSYNGEIYVMRADGGERRRLTQNPASDSGPGWSPDGERIVFGSGRNYPEGASYELYSIKPDGSCLTWLTNGTAQSGLPDWEPGAGRSSDPGGCGATPREPLIETDTSDLASYKSAPVWWLGLRFGELLLSEVDADGGQLYLPYEDCARFESAECPAPVQLDVKHVCLDARAYGTVRNAHPSTLGRHEGALVHRPRFEDEESAHIFTGPTIIDVNGRDGKPLEPIIDGLRRFGADAPPAAGMPLARLPLADLRALERMRAAYRKYGSVGAVARRLRTSRGTVRDRLALDRKLRQLGPFGRVDCSRR